MEEIMEGWDRLSLQGPKEDGFRLRSEMGFVEFILATKFFTKWVLNTDAIAWNFSQLWRSRNGFKIKDLGNYIILFIFDKKLESNRVLTSQPWSFDKHLVAIQRYERSSHTQDFMFWKSSFFGSKCMIFLYGLWIRWLLKAFAQVLGRFVFLTLLRWMEGISWGSEL